VAQPGLNYDKTGSSQNSGFWFLQDGEPNNFAVSFAVLE